MFSNVNESYRSGIPKRYYHLRDKNFSEWEIPPWELYVDTARKVGEGSFGEVYMAKWRETPVIAKVAHIEIGDIQKSLCIREFETLTKVHHPNVVQLLGYVSDPFIIVMEYLPGGNLETQNLSWRKRVDVCVDILRALAYLHNRKPEKIIHRDIKPSNVVLSRSGRAKLVDFGLSRIAELMVPPQANEDLTGSVGTLRYMAPEAKAKKQYSHKIDIWSAGVLMKKLLPYESMIDKHMLQDDPSNRLEALELVKLFCRLRDRSFWSCTSFKCVSVDAV
jgi:serine/threonine protein kinase